MKMNKMVSKIDDDILGQIISSCENHMVSPFKKKEVEIEVEPEMEDEDDSKKSDIAEKLSELDEDELLELYSKMKE